MSQSLKDREEALYQKYRLFYPNKKEFIATWRSYLESEKQIDQLSSKIIATIKKAWEKKEFTWFINYLKTISISTSLEENLKILEQISMILEAYQIEMQPSDLENLLESSDTLKELLSKICPKGKIFTFQEIESISTDELVVDFLYTYVLSQNQITTADISGQMTDEISEKDFESGMNDSTKMYLKEIGEIPLLTPEEEKEYFEALDRAKEEKNEKKAEKLTKKIAEANLRLVVFIAKRYIGKGLPFLDLTEEGNMGLLTAISKFKISKNIRFSTYATWWIRQSVIRSLSNASRIIRIPVHKCDEIRIVLKAAELLTKLNGSKALAQEIAQYLNMPVKTIEEDLLLSQGIVSIDELVGENKDIERGELIEDISTPSLEEQIIGSTLNMALVELLSFLTPREEFVIRMRFGIQTNENPQNAFESAHTLDEIAAELKVTRERVRQLEAKALRKLRYYSNEKNLASYVQFKEEPEPLEEPRQITTFKDYFGENTEEARIRADYLPKEYHDALIARFGICLDTEMPVTESVMEISKKAMQKIREIRLPNKKTSSSKAQTLQKILGCDIYQLSLVKKHIFLNSKQSALLIELFGNSLDRPLNTSVASENKIEWDSILEELKVFVRNIEADNKYEGLTFSQVLGCSESDLKLLCEVTLHPVYKKVHQENLDMPYESGNLTKQEKEKYHHNLVNLKERLERLHIDEGKMLFEIIGCLPEEFHQVKKYINAFIHTLPLIRSIFGPNLDEPKKANALLFMNFKAYNILITHLRKCIQEGQRKEETLQETLQCTDKQFNVIRQIILNNKDQKRIFSILYGVQLDEAFNWQFLNEENKNLLSKALATFLERIEMSNSHQNKKLEEIFEGQITAYIKKRLLYSDLKQEIAYFFANEAVDSLKIIEEFDRYNRLISQISKLISKIKENGEERSVGKTLQEILNTDEKDIEFIKMLTIKDQFAILKKAYGEDLNQKFNYFNLTEEEIESVISLLVTLEIILQERRQLQGKTLKEALQCSEKEYAIIKIYLSFLDDVMVLKEAYGENLDSVLEPEPNCIVVTAVCYLKDLLQNIRQLIHTNENVLSFLPLSIKKAIRYHLGLIDGIAHDANDVAKLLRISKEEARFRIESGMSIIKNLEEARKLARTNKE